jgi:hypothetical protein
MFIIRRRAAAAEFVPLLLDIMIFGSTPRVGVTSNRPDDEKQALFATETHNYFVGLSDDSLQEHTEQWSERDVRAKTGGPLFDLEEDDIVRSMRLSTLAELASVASPSALASHSRLLVRLATDALGLDRSRNVRRAAALLARALYGCLLREQTRMHLVTWDNADGVSQIRFAVALASIEAEEDLLCITLKNHAASVGFNKRVFDPATQCRCQEALNLREDAEEVMTVAKLEWAQEQGTSTLPRLIASMMLERPVIPEFDKEMC